MNKMIYNRFIKLIAKDLNRDIQQVWFDDYLQTDSRLYKIVNADKGDGIKIYNQVEKDVMIEVSKILLK